MAFEPINIFSRKIDPRGVAVLLRGCSPKVKVTGPVDDWEEIVVPFAGRFLRRGKVLTFGHHAEYYDGDGWGRQIMGMSNYFREFPDVPRKQEIIQAIGLFRFSLAVPQQDLDINSDDPRLDVLYAVCQHLDGLIFTPTSLRDAQGRILIESSGEYDSQAVLPIVPPTVEFEAEDGSPEKVDDDWQPDPPSAQRVAARAMVLAAVANRGLLENESPEDSEGFCQHMVQWLKDLSVQDEPEPDEWEILQRPTGTLAPQQMIDAIWRIEALTMLAWALGWNEMPAYDVLVAPPELFDAVGSFDLDTARQLIDGAELRSTDELEAMRRTQLAFHWRIRDFTLRSEAMDFVAFSQNCWFGSFDLTPFSIIDNDLAIAEVAIADADGDDISRMSSLANERHRTINWLHDGGPFSEADEST